MKPVPQLFKQACFPSFLYTVNMKNKHTETVLDSVATVQTFLPYPPYPTHLFITSAASVLASISLYGLSGPS